MCVLKFQQPQAKGKSKKTYEEPWNKVGFHQTQCLKIHQHVWICGNVQCEWQFIK